MPQLDVLAAYDAFLLRSAPVFAGDPSASSSAAPASITASAQPRSLSASAGTILRFFSGLRSLLPQQQQQQQPQQQPATTKEDNSDNDNPLLRPSTAALPAVAPEDATPAAGFVPMVSFVAAPVPEQQQQQQHPDDDDVLTTTWTGRHAGEDALRASYLAMYQCENL